MNRNINTLIFDFFGVICSEVSTVWFHDNFPGSNKEFRSSFMRAADKGEISQAELFSNLSIETGIHAEKIEKEWIALAKLKQDSLNLVRSQKGEYKLGLLSNTMTPFFHEITRNQGLEDLFDVILLSSDIAYAKPELEAYQKILQHLEVLPEEALMIDDNPKYVEAAKGVGMHGYVFTNTEELKKFLSQ